MINYNVYVENPTKYSLVLNEIRYVCERCGRKVIIPRGVKKQLCSYCKHYVYVDDLSKFKGKLGNLMKKRFI